LSPTDPTVPLGVPQQFTASGIFTDGTREDLTTEVAWDVSPTGVATVSAAGLATPLAVGGPLTVTARHVTSGIFGTTTLTVSAAALTAITIDQGSATVAAGTAYAFSVTGTYSDLSTADLTAVAAWASSDEAVATVSNLAGSLGVAKGLTPGTANITASFGGFSDFSPLTVTTAVLTSLAVSPASVAFPKGMTQTLQAIGTFSDGSTQDLTSASGWTSSVTTCAAVSNAPGQEGVVTALGAGTATITATHAGYSGSAAITVSNAAVTSIDVTAVTSTAPQGYTLQYHATAHYTDGSSLDVTTQATWQSSNTAIATVSNAARTQGLATAVAVGSANITATLAGKSGSAAIQVSSATLQSIAVTPSPFSVSAAAGPSHSVQLTAAGTFKSGGVTFVFDVTRQCSWSASPKRNWATVQLGLVTGVRAGSGTVTAKKGNKSGSASGTVF